MNATHCERVAARLTEYKRRMVCVCVRVVFGFCVIA